MDVLEKTNWVDLTETYRDRRKGGTRLKDINKIMKRIELLFVNIPEDNENRIVVITRMGTKVLLQAKVSKKVVASDIIQDFKNLKITGVKEAIEQVYDIKIPPEYLDKVGWKEQEEN